MIGLLLGVLFGVITVPCKRAGRRVKNNVTSSNNPMSKAGQVHKKAIYLLGGSEVRAVQINQKDDDFIKYAKLALRTLRMLTMN